MTDARYRLLETMQDLMSNYLLDECPTDTTWEDFDPGIDSLRSVVTDIIADNCSREICMFGLTTYIVNVSYISGDDHYGTETYSIAASTQEGAERRARCLSLDSVYNDPRIPDLRTTVASRPSDDAASPS